MKKPRVLFIHGLEGHPNGSKVQSLREQGFEVTAADMFMSVWSLKKRNSVIRHFLRIKEPWVVLAVIIGCLTVAAIAGWITLSNSIWFILCVIFSIKLWVDLRGKEVAAQAMGASFDACIAIQTKALADAKPDIVVGSSWGGAITTALLAGGIWHGPAILLAPASELVSKKTRRDDIDTTLEKLKNNCADIPVIIFHDPSDDVVPFADSERLANVAGLELRSVEAGGHRLLGLLAGQLEEQIRATLQGVDSDNIETTLG